MPRWWNRVNGIGTGWDEDGVNISTHDPLRSGNGGVTTALSDHTIYFGPGDTGNVTLLAATAEMVGKDWVIINRKGGGSTVTVSVTGGSGDSLSDGGSISDASYARYKLVSFSGGNGFFVRLF